MYFNDQNGSGEIFYYFSAEETNRCSVSSLLIAHGAIKFDILQKPTKHNLVINGDGVKYENEPIISVNEVNKFFITWQNSLSSKQLNCRSQEFYFLFLIYT